MIIFESLKKNSYYRLELLLPKLVCNSIQTNEIMAYRLTKFDLSTKFVLKDYDNRVMIEMRLLGFGLGIYLSWRDDEI